MKRLPLVASVALFLSLAGSAFAADEAPLRRYLYAASPDGAQMDTGSGTGVLIFDIDNGHKFVRRIDVPDFQEGIRGLTGSLANRCLYFSTTAKRMGCLSLETDEVLWNRTYESGCDRTCITRDGKTIYAPTGWWLEDPNDGFLVINAADGEFIRKISVGPKAHNSIASLDGKYLYLGTRTQLTQFSAADGSVVQTIDWVGESGIFPYTVDSRNEFAYVCLGRHVGFDVVNLKAGTVPYRVYAAHPETGENIPHRTHGAGMTPDERELWISDQRGQRLFIYDLTKMPPTPKGHVELSMGGHGWVAFSVDGKYAWSHTPDIFDVKTKKLVGTFKDEHGNPFASSKFIEVHFRGDDVVFVGNEFGLGRVDAGNSRLF